MSEPKQNILYLAIMAGLNIMCLAMQDIKRAQERANEPDAGK